MLVDYAGYVQISDTGESEGRGLFRSTKYKNMIGVIGNGVYVLNLDGSFNKVGTIDTFSGDVFIDENQTQQIAICDKKNIYIFNWGAGTFTKITGLDFTPLYVVYQDGYFIAPAAPNTLGVSSWRLSAPNDGTSWPSAPQNTGTFQTKPDDVVACIRMPGKGGTLLVMGQTVTEVWIDTGYQLFPYQRIPGLDLDYGCWGFMFKQDGHLIYQFTFPDDNKTFIYDFETKAFFNVSDENLNYHIARRVVYFSNSYYFISVNDGKLYELNSQYTNANGKIIPRIRIGAPMRSLDSSPYSIVNFNFLIEQGVAETEQRVDLAISKDGRGNFGSYVSKQLNPIGKGKNRLNYWNFGRCNDLTYQARFYSLDRFVVGNGVASYQQ